MTVKIYRSIENPDMGFSITETKGVVSVWVDEYEGGEAYETDLTFEEDFDTFDLALDYITKKWGKVELIDTY